MSSGRYKLFPLGDNALTIEFGQEISGDLNKQAIRLAEKIEDSEFPGLIEAVPAYASTTVFYDVCAVRSAYPNFATAFEAVSSLVRAAEARGPQRPDPAGRDVEVPVDFGGEDLDAVAEFAALTPQEVIEVFLSKAYRVYMLGFLPGFAYMGEVDERIAVPRRASPRMKVKKGSVGIAGRQTGVYPLESPGGWQIIGYTPLEMFDAGSEEPCLLRPGDTVRFKNING